MLSPGEKEPEDLQACAERIADLLARLPGMLSPRVEYAENGEAAEVYPFPYLSGVPERQKEFPTLSRALEAYYGTRDQQDRLRQKSASMVRLLKTQMERCEKKLALQEEELAGAARMEEYRIMGEVLNANLFALKKGQEEVTLPNWYDPPGGTVAIPLDPRLTPSQNAQKYFKNTRRPGPPGRRPRSSGRKPCRRWNTWRACCWTWESAWGKASWRKSGRSWSGPDT